MPLQILINRFHLYIWCPCSILIALFRAMICLGPSAMTKLNSKYWLKCRTEYFLSEVTLFFGTPSRSWKVYLLLLFSQIYVKSLLILPSVNWAFCLCSAWTWALLCTQGPLCIIVQHSKCDLLMICGTCWYIVFEFSKLSDLPTVQKNSSELHKSKRYTSGYSQLQMVDALMPWNKLLALFDEHKISH